MTTSNNPQSNKGGNEIPKVEKTAPTSAKDLNSFFAARQAEKIAKGAENLQRMADTKQERASRPWTPQETKAFFDRKREESKNRTPEQIEAAKNGFFKRKAEQYNRTREENFGELKAQPAHKDSSAETLYRLAEMRIDMKRELRKDGIEGEKFDKAVAKFDEHFAKPKNLEKVTEEAKAQAAELLEKKGSAKVADKSEGMSV